MIKGNNMLNNMNFAIYQPQLKKSLAAIQSFLLIASLVGVMPMSALAVQPVDTYTITATSVSVLGTVVNVSGTATVDASGANENTIGIAIDWNEDQGPGVVPNDAEALGPTDMVINCSSTPCTISWGPKSHDYASAGAGTYNAFAIVYHGQLSGVNGDGLASSQIDSFEIIIPPQCSNEVDDDGDTFIDFPDDPGCTDADDDSESPDPVVAPKLTVTKVVTNDNGGIKVIADFPLFVDATGVTSGVQNEFSAGAHSVSETTDAEYTSVISGDCAANGSITLAPGDVKACTITNDDKPAHLIVIKHVVNNNGGTAVASGFTMTINDVTASGGNSFAGAESPGTDKTLTSVGSYSFTETGPAGYDSSASADCSGTIALGQTKTCTITNDDIAPTIKVVKSVTNDNGGDAIETDFSFLLDSIISLFHNIAAQTSAGVHSVSENSFFGYTPGVWGGDCAANGSITLALDQDATCTITNDDIAPTLTLEKTVVNVDGGTATVADFQGKIDGSDVAWDSPIALNAGAHTASEVANVSGYDASDWGGDCNPDGTITLAPGENATCTITNDDIAPGLTLKKIVTTDNGGNEDESDFQGYIDGDPVVWNDAQTLGADTYTLSETGPDGYSASGWSCEGGSISGDQVTIGVGETVECTITNNDDAPTVTLIKDVTNDNGGTAGENDFGLSIGGTPVNSSQTLPVDANIPIEILELNLTGYSFVSIIGDEDCPSEIDGDVTLNEGEDITCTITNNDIAPSLTLVKEVINNDGGNLSASAWLLSASGPTPISGEGSASSGGDFSAGTYTLSENGPEGYAASAWSCEGGTQEGNSITLGLGEEATCTITNDDSAAVLTIVKNTEGGDGTFEFEVTGGEEFSASPSIETSSGTGSEDVALNPGTYNVIENVPEGWNFSGVSCEYDGESIGESIQNGEQISVDNGDHVTCTFNNTKEETPPPPPPPTPVPPPPPPSGGGGGGPILGSITTTNSGAVLGASTGEVLGASCGLYMDRFVRLNKRNNLEQVKKLQAFLNKWKNSKLPITGFYGPLSLAAVNQFQSHYTGEILAPWGISAPTGIVYQTTLRWINMLECPDLALQIPELVPWSKNPAAELSL